MPALLALRPLPFPGDNPAFLAGARHLVALGTGRCHRSCRVDFAQGRRSREHLCDRQGLLLQQAVHGCLLCLLRGALPGSLLVPRVGRQKGRRRWEGWSPAGAPACVFGEGGYRGREWGRWSVGVCGLLCGERKRRRISSLARAALPLPLSALSIKGALVAACARPPGIALRPGFLTRFRDKAGHQLEADEDGLRGAGEARRGGVEEGEEGGEARVRGEERER